jgi:hypothetical protein
MAGRSRGRRVRVCPWERKRPWLRRRSPERWSFASSAYLTNAARSCTCSSARTSTSCNSAIYFTTIYRDVGKGWHRHREMTLNYACVFGRIKLVLYDDREESPTKGALQEIFLGPDNHALVVIPPDVWNGDEGDERPLCDRRQLLYPSSRPVADDAARPIRQRHSVRLANPTPLTPGLAVGRIVVLESGSVHVCWGSPA